MTPTPQHRGGSTHTTGSPVAHHRLAVRVGMLAAAWLGVAWMNAGGASATESPPPLSSLTGLADRLGQAPVDVDPNETSPPSVLSWVEETGDRMPANVSGLVAGIADGGLGRVPQKPSSEKPKTDAKAGSPDVLGNLTHRLTDLTSGRAADEKAGSAAVLVKQVEQVMAAAAAKAESSTEGVTKVEPDYAPDDTDSPPPGLTSWFEQFERFVPEEMSGVLAGMTNGGPAPTEGPTERAGELPYGWGDMSPDPMTPLILVGPAEEAADGKAGSAAVLVKQVEQVMAAAAAKAESSTEGVTKVEPDYAPDDTDSPPPGLTSWFEQFERFVPEEMSGVLAGMTNGGPAPTEGPTERAGELPYGWGDMSPDPMTPLILVGPAEEAADGKAGSAAVLVKQVEQVMAAAAAKAESSTEGVTKVEPDYAPDGTESPPPALTSMFERFEQFVPEEMSGVLAGMPNGGPVPTEVPSEAGELPEGWADMPAPPLVVMDPAQVPQWPDTPPAPPVVVVGPAEPADTPAAADGAADAPAAIGLALAAAAEQQALREALAKAEADLVAQAAAAKEAADKAAAEQQALKDALAKAEADKAAAEQALQAAAGKGSADQQALTDALAKAAADKAAAEQALKDAGSKAAADQKALTDALVKAEADKAKAENDLQAAREQAAADKAAQAAETKAAAGQAAAKAALESAATDKAAQEQAALHDAMLNAERAAGALAVAEARRDAWKADSDRTFAATTQVANEQFRVNAALTTARSAADAAAQKAAAAAATLAQREKAVQDLEAVQQGGTSPDVAALESKVATLRQTAADRRADAAVAAGRAALAAELQQAAEDKIAAMDAQWQKEAEANGPVWAGYVAEDRYRKPRAIAVDEAKRAAEVRKAADAAAVEPARLAKQAQDQLAQAEAELAKARGTTTAGSAPGSELAKARLDLAAARAAAMDARADAAAKAQKVADLEAEAARVAVQGEQAKAAHIATNQPYADAQSAYYAAEREKKAADARVAALTTTAA